MSAGIRWWFIGAMTDPGGTLSVSQVLDFNEIMDGVADTYTAYTTIPNTVHTDLRKPGSFVFRPTEMARAEQFQSLSGSGTVTNAAFSGWNGVILTIKGASSTTPISIEWVFNLEASLDFTSGFGGRQFIPRNPKLVEAMENAPDSFIPGNENQVESRLMRQAKKAVKKGAKFAENWILDLIFGEEEAALAIADTIIELD